MCLKAGEHDGLNSKVNFDIVMVDTQLVDGDTLQKMQKLQPNAKVGMDMRCANPVHLPGSRHRLGSSDEKVQHHSEFSSRLSADISANLSSPDL